MCLLVFFFCSGSLRRLIRASLSQAVTVDGRIQQQDDETNLVCLAVCYPISSIIINNNNY